jgi:hypothetical protein
MAQPMVASTSGRSLTVEPCQPIRNTVGISARQWRRKLGLAPHQALPAAMAMASTESIMPSWRSQASNSPLANPRASGPGRGQLVITAAGPAGAMGGHGGSGGKKVNLPA